MKQEKSVGLRVLLLVGLAVMGVLIILYLLPDPPSGRIGTHETNIALIDTALQEFLLENERFPTQEEGLAALWVGPNDLKETWDGPYIDEEKAIDPWGRRFVYRIPSLREGMEFDLICYGRDGELGGEGEDRDHYNGIRD